MAFLLLAPAQRQPSLGIQDALNKRLSVTKTEDLLALRDEAYAFIDAINDELVKEGR